VWSQRGHNKNGVRKKRREVAAFYERVKDIFN
jgi:hypothetical protein